jgi:hypothetical protein
MRGEQPQKNQYTRAREIIFSERSMKRIAKLQHSLKITREDMIEQALVEIAIRGQRPERRFFNCYC